MADLIALKDSLSALTVMEVAELVKTLEEEWGVSAAAAVAAAPVAAGGEAAAEEEAESIKAKLEEAGASVELK